MAKELYSRDSTSAKYQSTLVEVNDKLSFLILQLENIFFTNKKEVIGLHNFGLNLEDLLFTLDSNENEIKEAISTQIGTYCPLAKEFEVHTSVSFIHGNQRDIGIIDIIIDGNKALTLLL